MSRVDRDIREVRSRICNVLLVILAIAAVPALAASLFRIATIGWIPIMVVQLGLFAYLLILVLFRNRIPYEIRAGSICAGFLALGLGGLWQVGLVGSAIVFLVVMPAVCTMLFGARFGLISLAVTVLGAGLIGVLTVSGDRLPAFDPASYLTQPSAWFSAVLGCALVAGSLLAALIIYNRDLHTALQYAAVAEDELTRRIEDRTSELTREIEERRAVESELRETEAALTEANASLEKRIEARTRELQAEKEKFRSIVENAPVRLSLKDLDGTLMIVNPLAREQAEAAGVELVEGQTAYEVWPAELANMFREQDRAVVETNRTNVFEVVIPTNDAQHVIRATKFPVRNSDGEITAIGTIGVDITREREAETKLRESEERFRSLVEFSPNAASLKDLDGRYLLVNGQFETLLGVRREDVIGKTADQVFAGAFSKSGIEQDREVIRRNEAVQFDELFNRGDRTLHFLTTKFPIFGGDGNIAFVAAIHTDLTERKEAEETLARREAEYRLLVELIPDAVVVQCGGRVMLANQSACAMFGADSMQDMVGMDSLQLVHPDYQDFVLGQRNRALAEQVSLPPAQTRHQRLDGTSFDSEYTTGPLVWDGRAATVSLIRDVTERNRAEEQLHQAQKMETVGQLTGGVAHDFNNLLAVIMGNAEMLGDRVDEEGKAQIDAIVRATQRGSDLTHRLLAFSRKQVLAPKVINVNTVLQDTVGLLRRTLPENIAIETVVPKGLWNCEIDPTHLENALLNLAVNARDAMPEGGKLTIEAANRRLHEEAAAPADIPPGQYVVLSVTDTGTGIPANLREQVFEPFFTTKEVGKGTGLGLSMILGFVKQSGGHITIDSEVDDGTSVKLYLPRCKAEKEILAGHRKSADATPGDGEVILVAEDDADIRSIVFDMLESLGYDVLMSGSAKGAMELLEQSPGVSLLLTDVVLPGGIGGRALADQVSRQYPDLPVLYMSGYAKEEQDGRESLDGHVQILEKPFRKNDLAQAVRTALSGKPA